METQPVHELARQGRCPVLSRVSPDLLLVSLLALSLPPLQRLGS